MASGRNRARGAGIVSDCAYSRRASGDGAFLLATPARASRDLIDHAPEPIFAFLEHPNKLVPIEILQGNPERGAEPGPEPFETLRLLTVAAPLGVDSVDRFLELVVEVLELVGIARASSASASIGGASWGGGASRAAPVSPLWPVPPLRRKGRVAHLGHCPLRVAGALADPVAHLGQPPRRRGKVRDFPHWYFLHR